MSKCLIFFALTLVFASCAPEQLVIERYIKSTENKVKANGTFSTKKKVDHFDVNIVSSKIADISYYINVDNEIKAILLLKNGHTLEISVANGLLNDANLIGREISYPEQLPVYKIDTTFAEEVDTVFVSNLVCEKKIIKKDNYIVKVYDYVTARRYKVVTDKKTFETLIEAPAYAYLTDEQGFSTWSANTDYCVSWNYALNFKGFKFTEILFSPNTCYDIKLLNRK